MSVANGAGSSAAAAMGSAGAPNAVDVAAFYLTSNSSCADDSTTSGDSQSILDGGKLNIPDGHILDLPDDDMSGQYCGFLTVVALITLSAKICCLQAQVGLSH